jgi:hypothetical protein
MLALDRPVMTGEPDMVGLTNVAPEAVKEPVNVLDTIVEAVMVELVTVAEVNVPPVNVALVAVNAPVTVPLE